MCVLLFGRDILALYAHIQIQYTHTYACCSLLRNPGIFTDLALHKDIFFRVQLSWYRFRLKP